MADSFEGTARARRSPAGGARTLAGAFAGVALASACSGYDGPGSYTPSSAGSGGGGGTDGGPTGPTGTIQVLSDDAERLLGPTTVAVRYRDDLFESQDFWVVNGQLSGLLSGAPAVLPFSAVAVYYGAVRATEVTLDGNFYPEGIASSNDGTLYIGSVALNTVVRVPANSTTPEPFVPAGVAAAGVMGMEVDDALGLLWLCDSDPRDMPRTGAVVGVSLDDGSEVVRHVLAAPDAGSLFCNDVAIDDVNGDVWATESIAGIIYRIDAADVMTPDSAEIWMRGGLAAPPAGGFGPNGLVVAGNTLFVANAGNGALFAVDKTSDDPVADARAITLSEGDRTGVSLCGPDGLLGILGPTDGTDLIVVENGDCTAATPRVVRIYLD
jgi:hypothetical protein